MKHGAGALCVLSLILLGFGAFADDTIPTSSVIFNVLNNTNVNQSVWIPNGILLEVWVFPGAYNTDITIGAGIASPVATLTVQSGYVATSATFRVNVTDINSGNNLNTTAGDGLYITLSGGNIDQNSYLYVRNNGSWVPAASTCGNQSRTYNRYKLSTKVCTVGTSGFAVYRTDQTNKTLCSLQSPDKLVVGSYPVLDIDNTKFVNNTLFTNIIGPYVAGRSYTNITMSGANSTICNMNGAAPNIWNSSFTSCRDVLSLALKWVNHTVCGFTTYSFDDNQITFKGTVNLVYSDAIGTFSGVPVTRSTQHNYDIYITFQKQIIVTFSGLNVTSDVGIDIALTAEKYTAATGLLTVELTTAVVWSYKLDNTSTVLTTPSGITQSGNLTFDGSSCTTAVGTLCVQKITFALSLGAQNSTCTFDGLYSVVTNLLACSPSGTGCSATNASFTFSLFSGPVCTSFTVKPVVTGTLQAYAALPLTTPINSFKLGDQVYFAVNVNAGTGNTLTVKFNSVAFDDGSGAGFKYLLQNYAVVSQYSAVNLVKVESSFYFSLYLTGSVFRIPYESQATYVFNVTVDLIFDGNTKRTIETQFEASPHINTLTRVYLTPEDDEFADDGLWVGSEDGEEEVVGQVADDAASLPVVVGAVVGVVAFNVLVSMLVIAFYRKMTAQNRYSQVPTTA